MSVTFTDNSAKIIGKYNAAIKKALPAIGATGEKHAKLATPVDTGRLRNSIAHAHDNTAAYIGTNVEYGPYIELGTRYMEGYHMIQKACQNHSAEYKQIAKAVKKALKKSQNFSTALLQLKRNTKKDTESFLQT